MPENKKFNPDLRELLSGRDGNQTISRYSLVSATAKLARQIADERLENPDPNVTEKPVSVALEELLDGEYYIEEPEEIRNL